MLSGMLVIGFLYNIPFSIGLVNKGLLGFLPPLNRQFYFYIMLGGTFLIIFVTNKNLYCERLCPFGATQECLSAISGTIKQLPKKFRKIFIWIQRIMALGVVVLALVMRKPDYANYEVFGTMFRLTGGNFSFVLLLVFLILSLIIVRPWCNYLCPVHPVTEYARMIRRWIRN
jgi:polyferredoxin